MTTLEYQEAPGLAYPMKNKSCTYILTDRLENKDVRWQGEGGVVKQENDAER